MFYLDINKQNLLSGKWKNKENSTQSDKSSLFSLQVCKFPQWNNSFTHRSWHVQGRSGTPLLAAAPCRIVLSTSECAVPELCTCIPWGVVWRPCQLPWFWPSPTSPPSLPWSGRRKGLGAACPLACSIAGSLLKTERIGLLMLNRIIQQQIALTEVWLRYRKLNLTVTHVNIFTKHSIPD